MLDLSSVVSLSQAKSKTWSVIGELQSNSLRSSLQILDDQILIVGSEQGNSTQYFNLKDYSSGIYENTIYYCGVGTCSTSRGLIWPGIFSTDKSVSIFGGYKSSLDCIQQNNDLDNLESRWTCSNKTTTVSTLEGLSRYDDELSVYRGCAVDFVNIYTDD
jgi:hypothetical protein